MNLIEIILRYFWIVFIAVSFINIAIMYLRAKKYIKDDPSLKDGYKKISIGISIFFNIPWIIIGIGNITGLTTYITDYFYPKLLNPIVIVFHISIIILWFLLLFWIFIKNGADFLVKHPGLININLNSTQIKVFTIISVLFGALAMLFLWTQEIPPVTIG